jgi:membrane protein implicated in regulation of membrane protease activity
MTILALIGAKALYLLWAWLASSIVASLLSARKGYGEKPGLATGLLLSAVGVLIWLVWPARQGSLWKTDGPLPKRGQRLTPPPVAPEGDEAADGGDTAPGPSGQSAS